MKQVHGFRLTLVFLSLCFCVGVPGGGTSAAGESDNRNTTGCVRPSAGQIEWERKNMIVTRRVRLNQLGLGRVNARRGRKGLRALTGAEAGVVPLGSETVGATAAAASAEAEFGTIAPAEIDVLPAYVDNSTLKYFPPIRSQGSVGSCAQWSGMYYCYTYMNAMARDLDVKADGSGDNSLIFSPKFTYNMVNGGVDAGSWYTDGWAIAQKHGCAVWSEWPYDSNYRAWPRTADIWRNALSYRADAYGHVVSSASRRRQWNREDAATAAARCRSLRDGWSSLRSWSAPPQLRIAGKRRNARPPKSPPK